MTQWALEHPYLTAILVVFLVSTIGNIAGYFAKVRIAKHTGAIEEDEN